MKVLLDIQDNKALHLLEVLKGLSYVKTTQLTDSKAQVFQELKEAVDEVNMIKSGKGKSKPLNEFLNDL